MLIVAPRGLVGSRASESGPRSPRPLHLASFGVQTPAYPPRLLDIGPSIVEAGFSSELFIAAGAALVIKVPVDLAGMLGAAS